MNLKRFLLLILFSSFFTLSNCAGVQPKLIGSFAPCPKSPNCVSTRSNSKKHSIKPFLYNGKMELAKKRLLGIISKIPRAKIGLEKEKFIHVEFTSRIFGFVDDVEFYFDKEGIISFRSASRLGYSDLGVNRDRMESIRKLLIKNKF